MENETRGTGHAYDVPTDFSEGSAPFVLLPLRLPEAALLLETVDTRLALLDHTRRLREMMKTGKSAHGPADSADEIVRQNLEEQRAAILRLIQPLLVPSPVFSAGQLGITDGGSQLYAEVQAKVFGATMEVLEAKITGTRR